MTDSVIRAPSTRLAPTPSGRLHAGNAFSFVLAWLWSRTRGGRVVLRIEDTDTTRSRPEWVEGVFRDLEWLGLDWDEGPCGPGDLQDRRFQSSVSSRARYTEILDRWTDAGLVYPCRCTRRDIALDAPQVERLEETEPSLRPYSGKCRDRRTRDAGSADAWRLRLPSKPSRLVDGLRGVSEIADISRLGDPVLRRADGCFAYHLAVCVDDADQGIDTVVRGRDLAPWSHLHQHLHGLLGHTPPEFVHHGLAGSPGGERLAKRIGSWSLEAMRTGGIPPEHLLGRLAPFLHPASDLDGTPVGLSELVGLGPPTPLSDDLVLTLPEHP